MRVRGAHAIAIAALVFAGAAAGCSEEPPSADVAPAPTVTQLEPTPTVATSASTAAEPGSTVAASVAETPVIDVPAALAFRAPLVGGGEFDGAAYAGRPVAFWFWAPT